MRKAHIALLIITAILALSSAYSLAAMNQVFKVDFSWFSQLTGQYSSEVRDTSEDKCILANDKLKLQINLAGKKEFDVAHASGNGYNIDQRAITTESLFDNIYIICSLGKVNSPEYRIKVTDIAQRGNNVEVRLSINTPAAEPAQETWKLGRTVSAEPSFYPQDIIQINKKAFPNDGRLYFVFKNQDGNVLYEQYFDI